jgi:hypothetical protein
MDFKLTYLKAMREQAPQMFKELRQRGALEAHLSQKSKQAHSLYDQLTDGAEKLPNGVVRDPNARQAAEEQVFSTLLDFPTSLPDGPDLTPQPLQQ